MYWKDGRWVGISWRQYSTRVQRLASYFIDQGVGGGVKVALLSATRQEWTVAAMAVLAAGGTLVPIDPALDDAALVHVLSHSDAEILVVEGQRLLRHVLSSGSRMRLRRVVSFEPVSDMTRIATLGGVSEETLDGLLLDLEHAEQLGAQGLERRPYRVLEQTDTIRLNDIALLAYTRGTGGSPKGVPLTHFNLGSSGAAWIEVNGPLCHEGDIDLLWLPLASLFGWGELCLGNYLGFLSYLSDPASVLPRLGEIRPHIFMSRATTWERLADLARAAGSDRGVQIAELKRLTGGRLYFCLSGGAGLSLETKELFLEASLLIVEGYGVVECSPMVTTNRYNAYDLSSVGQPMPRVELQLAPDGEILVKGPNVFAGYYKDPEATRAAFDEQGWFRTGDLGQLDERGFLRLAGRKGALAAGEQGGAGGAS